MLRKMQTITPLEIELALSQIERGLSRYLWLQDHVRHCDVGKDEEFQKNVVAFYRVRRNRQWLSIYFALLEKSKYEDIDFAIALNHLHRLTGNVEASFASKLVATLDSAKPVIDSFVLDYFDLHLPRWGASDREPKAVELYRELCDRYSSLMENPLGSMIVEMFDHKYPGCPVSKLKKIDLVLWQRRERSPTHVVAETIAII